MEIRLQSVKSPNFQNLWPGTDAKFNKVSYLFPCSMFNQEETDKW
jgi:hypothetical protein